MPLNIDLQQILLHLFNFVILATGLSLLLFRPVRKFMNERQSYFEEAERKNKEDAEKNEALHAEYLKKLEDADLEISRKNAEAEAKIADDSRQAMQIAKDKAAAILNAAEADAESRKAHILESAQAEIGELVVTATEKLLSQTAGQEHDRALYDAFIQMTKDHGSDDTEAE